MKVIARRDGFEVGDDGVIVDHYYLLRYLSVNQCKSGVI
tara:strand:- start:288 stop:404 length:117 start_codon:yes stop_codon:yes gene_type:complete